MSSAGNRQALFHQTLLANPPSLGSDQAYLAISHLYNLLLDASLASITSTLGCSASSSNMQAPAPSYNPLVKKKTPIEDSTFLSKLLSYIDYELNSTRKKYLALPLPPPELLFKTPTTTLFLNTTLITYKADATAPPPLINIPPSLHPLTAALLASYPQSLFTLTPTDHQSTFLTAKTIENLLHHALPILSNPVYLSTSYLYVDTITVMSHLLAKHTLALIKHSTIPKILATLLTPILTDWVPPDLTTSYVRLLATLCTNLHALDMFAATYQSLLNTTLSGYVQGFNVRDLPRAQEDALKYALQILILLPPHPQTHSLVLTALPALPLPLSDIVDGVEMQFYDACLLFLQKHPGPGPSRVAETLMHCGIEKSISDAMVKKTLSRKASKANTKYGGIVTKRIRLFCAIMADCIARNCAELRSVDEIQGDARLRDYIAFRATASHADLPNIFQSSVVSPLTNPSPDSPTTILPLLFLSSLPSTVLSSAPFLIPSILHIITSTAVPVIKEIASSSVIPLLQSIKHDQDTFDVLIAALPKFWNGNTAALALAAVLGNIEESARNTAAAADVVNEWPWSIETSFPVIQQLAGLHLASSPSSHPVGIRDTSLLSLETEFTNLYGDRFRLIVLTLNFIHSTLREATDRAGLKGGRNDEGYFATVKEAVLALERLCNSTETDSLAHGNFDTTFNYEYYPNNNEMCKKYSPASSVIFNLTDPSNPSFLQSSAPPFPPPLTSLQLPMSTKKQLRSFCDQFLKTLTLDLFTGTHSFKQAIETTLTQQGLPDPQLALSKDDLPYHLPMLSALCLLTVSLNVESKKACVDKCLKYYNPGTRSKTEFYRQTLLVKNIVECVFQNNLDSTKSSDVVEIKENYLKSLYKSTVKVIKNFPFVAKSSDDISNELYVGNLSTDDKKKPKNSANQRADNSDSDSDKHTNTNDSMFDSGDDSFSDSDSDGGVVKGGGFTQRLNKRRKNEPLTNMTQNAGHNPMAGMMKQNNNIPPAQLFSQFHYHDSHASILSASLLSLLSPTKKSLKIVAESFAWPRETLETLQATDPSTELFHSPSTSDIVKCVCLFTTPAAILNEVREKRRQTPRSRNSGEHSSSQDSILTADVFSPTTPNALPPPPSDDLSTITVPFLLTSMLSHCHEITPSSHPLHGCGYALAAEMVAIIGTEIDEKDVDDVIDFACTNDKTLKKSVKARPNLRASQLAAITKIFKAAGKDQPLFKKLSDKFVHLVFTAMKDPSLAVRTESIESLVVAFNNFPHSQTNDHKHMVASTLEQIPPITKSSDASIVEAEWAAWIASLPGERSEQEVQAFTSLRSCMESTSLKVMATLVSTTMSVASRRKLTFDLVLICASRADLEPRAIAFLHESVKNLGYSTLDSFFKDDLEWFLVKWLDTGNPLEAIPLLACSGNSRLRLTAMTAALPPMLLPLDEDAMSEGSIQNDTSPFTPYFDSEQMHIDLVYDFLENTAQGILIPCIMRLMKRTDVPHEGDTAMETEIQETALNSELMPLGKRASPDITAAFQRNAGFERMVELCTLLKGEGNDVAIAKLLKANLAYIYGYIFPLLESTNESRKKMGQQIFLSLGRCVDMANINIESFKIRHKTVLVILQNLSNRVFESDDGERVDMEVAAFILAIQSLEKDPGSDDRRQVHIFQSANTSTVEIVLHLKTWFEVAETDAAKQRLTDTLRMIVEQTKLESEHNQEINASAVSICQHEILNLLGDPKFQRFTVENLKMLDSLIKLCSADKDPENQVVLARLLNKTVLKVIEVYETASKERMKAKLVAESQERRGEFEGLGLIGLAERASNNSGTNEIDVWGWGTNSTGGVNLERRLRLGQNDETRELEKVEKCCLSLLEDILLKSPESFNVHLAKLDPLPVPEVPEGDQLFKILTTFNTKHHKIGEDQDVQTLMDVLRRFVVFCKRDRNSKRSLIAMLVKVSEVFYFLNMKHKSAVKAGKESGESFLEQGEGQYFGLFSDVLKNLSGLCGEDQEEEVVVEAGKVVGEISSYNWSVLCEGVGATKGEEGDDGDEDKGKGSVLSGAKGEQMLRLLKMKILKQLGGCLLSEDSETALVAMDLVKAIMATKSGKETLADWKKEDSDGEMEWVRQILLTVSSSISDTINQGRHNVPDSFIVEHLGALSGSGEGCWSEEFWKCTDSGKEAYESWAKRLSTSIILTCYHNYDPRRKKKKKKSAIAANVVGTQIQQIEGLDEFLGLCGSLCCREVDFAVCCLPALMLDMLICGGDPSGQSNSQDSSTSGSGGFSMASEVGIVDGSFPHLKLTKSVQFVLQHIPQCNKKVLAVIVDSLDVLRRTTTSAFLEYRNHKKNTSAPQGKVYPDADAAASAAGRSRGNREPTQTEEEYNSGLNAVVKWAGCQYGVVLRLSGLAVAEACLRCNRPCSALMYLDMYCDNSFGGSTECFSKVLEGEGFDDAVTGDGDVSGYGSNSGSRLLVTTVMNDVAKLRSILLEAHTMLSDDGSVIGVKNSTVGLEFKLQSGANSAFINGGLSTDMIAADMRLLGGSGSWQDKQTLGMGLRDLGLNHVMEGYLTGADSTDELEELWSEGAWRSMAWDDGFLNGKGPADAARKASSVTAKGGFHKHLHECLLDVVKNDRDAFFTELEQGRLVVARKIGETAGGESTLREFLRSGVKLWSFQEIEDVGNCVFNGRSWKTDMRDLWKESMNMNSLGDKQGLALDQSRGLREVREVALKCLYFRGVGEEREELGKFVLDTLKSGVQVFNETGQPREAWRCLERLKKDLVGLNGEAGGREFLEIKKMESEISWALGDCMGAIRLAKLVAERAEKLDNGRVFLTEVLLTCGSWMALSKTDSARQVMEGYLKPAVNHSRENRATIDGKAHLTLAEFLADLYESLVTRVKSVEWTRQCKAMTERIKERDACQVMYDEVRKTYQEIQSKKKLSATQEKEKTGVYQKLADISLHLKNLRKEVDMDMSEKNFVESSLVDYMKKSLENFVHGLAGSGDGGDLSSHVFRCVSIWFRNSEVDGVNKIMKGSGDRGVPSWLFIPLVYQLFARVGSGGKEFQEAINKMVLKLSSDHPHHCIVQLIALANGKKVGAGRSTDAFLKNVGQEKSDSAAVLIAMLRKKGDDHLRKLCDSIEKLSDAYINLAMAPTEEWVKANKTRDVALSQSMKRGGEVTLDKALGDPWSSRRGGGWAKEGAVLPAVMTKMPMLKKDANYTELVDSERIVGFTETFSLTDTGLHRPKIVVAVGESGRFYKQLVKGEDDIRQDAIMEQVFEAVNRVLRNQKLGLLNISTYVVVPLSPVSGVLEWVQNTEPFGDFLQDSRARGGKAGAHSKYNPGDWSYNACRAHFKNATTEACKISGFNEICARYKPAFRYFFLERWGHSVRAWHAAKNNYIRSTAASSMIGHILGIGDRHTHNILLNNKSGAVVHIDFGIVFGQGKVLTTPETVPFRLTPDIVDGLGVNGVGGLFSESCCAVLKVLRENSSSLLTILEVTANDPLFKFTVSPVAVAQKQRREDENADSEGVGGKRNGNQIRGVDDGSGEDENEAAKRVLMNIRQKLEGYEESTPEVLSVEGQVQMLISEARSVENLCRLFVGWAPWV
jgi:ataxia telangiectasia mutated family protein